MAENNLPHIVRWESPKPPYAEPHVRWCERSVNVKVGDKHLWLAFTSYSIMFAQHGYILTTLFMIAFTSLPIVHWAWALPTGPVLDHLKGRKAIAQDKGVCCEVETEVSRWQISAPMDRKFVTASTLFAFLYHCSSNCGHFNGLCCFFFVTLPRIFSYCHGESLVEVFISSGVSIWTWDVSIWTCYKQYWCSMRFKCGPFQRKT